MSNIIIEKYKNLYEACKKYPKITLSSKWGKSSKSYEKTKQYAKDGFAEESGGGIMAEINSYKECTEYKDLKDSELWSWNKVDNDTWTHGTFNSREEALNDAICSIEAVRSYLETDIPTIYLGRCHYVPLRTDVDVERVLKYLDEAYCEDTDCENYIYESVTDEQFKWLEDKFSEVMEEFHKMANISPSWFNVTEIEEIDLSEYVKQC